MIIYRHREAREIYIETHSLRHPRIPGPPDRIIHPLNRIVTK